MILAVTRPVFRGLRRLLRCWRTRALAGRLAVTRPVFRGLRLDTIRTSFAWWAEGLAVTRPVFRGLRLVKGAGGHEVPGKPACSDETRFQGIATERPLCCIARPYPLLAVTRPVFRGLRLENLFCCERGQNSHLAVTRPVFRGLRPNWRSRPFTRGTSRACSDETRFQGIATFLFLSSLGREYTAPSQ